MRCKKCNEKLNEIDIFCPKCGKATNALKTTLSAKNAIKTAWNDFKDVKSKFIPVAIIMTLLAIIPIVLLTVFKFTENYYLDKLKYVIFLPFLIIPFWGIDDFKNEKFNISRFFSFLKYYPRALFFTFCNFIYFFILRFLCSGKPFFYYSYDPILNIVFFIMTLYWYATIVPAFGLMMDKNLNPFKALILSYKAGKETRWQQFFIMVLLAAMLGLSLLTFGLGFLIAIPFSYFILAEYYKRMDEYKLFSENK